MNIPTFSFFLKNNNIFVLNFKQIIATILCLTLYTNSVNAQQYPPSQTGAYPDTRPYQSPTTYPNMLAPFTEPVNNLTVTRITDKNMSSNPVGYQMRHDYSKDQCWNADGTEIMLSAYNGQAQILDGDTYQFKRWATNIPSRQRWSYTNPDIMYGVSGNRLVSVHATTGVVTTIHTFTGYSSIDLGLGEGNQSNDDRYWAVLGKVNGDWNNVDFICYDRQTDTVLGTLPQGNLSGLIDWASMTQNGEYFVVRYNAYGSGNKQGIKRWNKNFTGQFNVWSNPQHGDIGVAQNGNPVWVTIGSGVGYYLHMTDMVTGVTTGLVWQESYGIEGAHVSCRNVNRPGWAYISVEPPVSNVNANRMTREMFAVKLDNSNTFERWGFHNASSRVYWQQPHVTPNHDGTKVMFASSWGNSSVDSDNYAPSFVVEKEQDPNGITANAGTDVSICNGSSTTLTATGGSTYLWSTGATTASISVSPTTTTTYTVTAYDATGTNSDTDDVTVTVNAIPVANAGADVSTCQGTSVTLSASGGSSYLWSTGATTQTINVNPNSTTTYSVQVTQNGCSSLDTVMVTVNPSPTINAGSDVTINLGESTTLTATGGNTYLWSTGSTSSSITVSPTVTTTYTVTGYLNGCESTDTVTVFLVDNSVTANAGTDVSICNGSSTTLTATGGSTYLWSTGATTASISVSPTTTTTYTVTAYDATGTNSDTDDVTVTVNAIPVANAGADVSTCQGTSVTLSASGGSSYLWSTGATTQTINVNPNSTTTYSVQVTQNGCSSSDTVTVTVNPSPTINAGSDVTINLGESTTLTATGGNTYLWSTGSTSSSITVSPTVTTTYTVTGYLNGCQNTNSVTVFVNSANANAGQDQTICNGYSATLTATGGDTYLWSTGATTQSITVNPTSTSTYTVTAYVGNSQDTDSVIVTVNPNPNVVIANGSEVSILEGEYVTLSVSGANTYLWNNGATQPNIAVSPNTTTTYSVTGYINNCSDTKQVTVNVFESVSANAGEDVTVCLDDNTVTLTAAASSGGDQFLWSTGETTSSIIVSPEVDTEYTVTVYNELDYDTDEVMVFVNDCIDTEVPDDSESLEFLVYPNPTFGDLNIKITGLLNVSSIHLYDLSGKALYSETISDGEEHTYFKTLNLSNFAAGIYLLKLVDNRNVITKKIVLR